MQDLFLGTRLVDLVLVITVLEAIALLLLYRYGGRGVPPAEWILNLMSGLFLMLAVRCAQSHAGWPWLATCLAAAGTAHGCDLARRWRRASAQIRPS